MFYSKGNRRIFLLSAVSAAIISTTVMAQSTAENTARDLVLSKARQFQSKHANPAFDITYNQRHGAANISGFQRDLSSMRQPQLDGRVSAFLRNNQELFRLDTDRQLFLKQQRSSDARTRHLSYEQRHGMYRVWGRSLTVHVQDNAVNAVTGNTVPNIAPGSATLAIDKNEAIATAKSAFGQPEPALKLDSVEQVVLYDDQSDSSSWVYVVELATMTKGKRYFVDGNSGEIVKVHSRIYDASATGSGIDLQGNQVDNMTIYAGNDFAIPSNSTWQQVMGDATKGDYNLVDVSNSQTGHLYTMTANNTYLTQIDFVRDSDTTFTSAGNSHPAGVSAHSTFRSVVDYFKVKHNRNGIDGNGMPVIAIVDMGDDSSTQEREHLNAFWSGSLGFMAFGIGEGQYSNFAGGLDVIGHELAHGVTDRASGLVYENQSGAMNEAVSDMFGYLIELYARGSANWELGEDILPNGFRNLADPNSHQQPDYVGGPYYKAPVATPNENNDHGYVHTNSGIPNKMFYLLVAGGTHRGITVAPFDSNLTTSAEQVGELIYLANTGGYFQSNTDFVAARSQMLAAVASLFPGDKAKVDSVKNAWAAVAVGSPATGGGTNVLEKGVAKTGLSGAKDSQTFYSIEVPAGASNLTFTMSGGTGDADLYIKAGSQPTSSRGGYDCGPYETGNNESCSFATPSATTYHVLLNAYEAYSGVSLVADYNIGGSSAGTLDETGLGASLRSWLRYEMEIPAGTSQLVVSLSGGSGDADLYLKQGSEPSRSSYDCRSWEDGNGETCTIDNPAAGTWHIGLYGYKAFSDVTLTGRANP